MKKKQNQSKAIAKPGHPQLQGMGLTPEQERFVLAYVRPDMAFNSTRAYMEAYGVEEEYYHGAAASASRLLRNVKIQAAISKLLEKAYSDNEELTRRVMGEFAKIAFIDTTELLDVQGPIVFLRRFEDLPVHFRSAIKSVANTSNGIKVEFHDKVKALESLAKCMGLFVDVQKNVGESYETLVQKLAREENETKQKGEK